MAENLAAGLSLAARGLWFEMLMLMHAERAMTSMEASESTEPHVLGQEADVSTRNLAEENAASESRMLRFSHEPAVRSEANSSIRIGIRCGRTTTRMQIPSRRWIASVRQRIGDHVGNRNADGESWITNGRLDAPAVPTQTLNMKRPWFTVTDASSLTSSCSSCRLPIILWPQVV
jgi:hypothetical protein